MTLLCSPYLMEVHIRLGIVKDDISISVNRALTNSCKFGWLASVKFRFDLSRSVAGCICGFSDQRGSCTFTTVTIFWWKFERVFKVVFKGPSSVCYKQIYTRLVIWIFETSRLFHCFREFMQFVIIRINNGQWILHGFKFTNHGI